MKLEDGRMGYGAPFAFPNGGMYAGTRLRVPVDRARARRRREAAAGVARERERGEGLLLLPAGGPVPGQSGGLC